MEGVDFNADQGLGRRRGQRVERVTAVEPVPNIPEIPELARRLTLAVNGGYQIKALMSANQVAADIWLSSWLRTISPCDLCGRG
jgi:hypothetical protein